MTEKTPCFISDSEEARLIETTYTMIEKQIEDHTDYLLDECKSAKYCEKLIIQYEMLDGCSAIMAEIANWTGRSDDANERMRNLHNLLSNALREIAEYEVEA